MSRIVSVFVLLLVGLQLACQTPPEVTDTPLPTTKTTYYNGDKILIDFTDNTGLPPTWQQTIREDGTISLPLNQTLLAGGKTKGELEQAIRELYVPKLLTRLTVNIRADSRYYFVQGEIDNPGQREHTGNITVMKAIAAAGDFTDFADKSNIELIRANGQKIKVDGKRALKNPAYDQPVYPNDTVHVHRRWF